jgi:hypothetical protein
MGLLFDDLVSSRFADIFSNSTRYSLTVYQLLLMFQNNKNILTPNLLDAKYVNMVDLIKLNARVVNLLLQLIHGHDWVSLRVVHEIEQDLLVTRTFGILLPFKYIVLNELVRAS